MNDIQQLIDRYLAEGLSSDELVRLSRAVHRDDAPEEWLVIREMIDTLSEGEDDYDLLVAASAENAEITSTKIAPIFEHADTETASRVAIVRKCWRIAASILLIAAIGATLYFTRHREPELASITMGSIDSISAPEQRVKPVEASTAVEEKASLEKSALSPKPAKRKLAAKTRPASPCPHVSASEPADIAETNDLPAAYEVPERRIYSCNLLDQVSDYDDAPAPATDGY